MLAKPSSPEIPLPRGWPSRGKPAVLHVISLGQFSLAYTRGWAANSPNSRIRLKAELDRACQEITLLREEIRIKDVRWAQLSPHRRPYYPPTERMATLQLCAARNWSQEQTAHAFLVAAETIGSWLRRVDEKGPNALVQLAEPVNKFPEFVRYIVKDEHSKRPLGLPALEDKIVQKGIAMILEAIYEADFLDCSYGFRPGRNRRSQRRSFSWAGLGAYLKHDPLPKPRIVHNLYTLSPVT